MKICFVPYFESGSQIRYDSTFFFDDYILSLDFKIIRYFSVINNHTITVKAVKHTTFADILKDYIAKNQFTNICFHDGRLSETLERCDLAIIDYPSSAILDASKANIPTLVLAYKELLIREKALDEFNNISLFQYAKPADILDKIDSFISSNEIFLDRIKGKVTKQK